MSAVADTTTRRPFRRTVPRRVGYWLSAERGVVTLSGAALLLVVVYPVVWLFLLAFGAPGQLSAHSLTTTLTAPGTLTALRNTVLLGVGCAVLSGAFGAPLAWLVVTTDIAWKRLVNVGVAIAFVMPPYLVALAYHILAAPRSGYLNRLATFAMGTTHGPFNVDNMWGTIFVSSLHGYAFVYFLTANALRSVDPGLEHSARMLGSSRMGATCRITLPVVGPAITSGMLLAGAQATVMLGVQLYLGTPGRVSFFTTMVYGHLQAIPPDISGAAALALVLAALTVIALLARHLLLRNRSYVTVTGKSTDRTPLPLGAAKVPVMVVVFGVLALSTAMPAFLLLITSVSKSWLSSPSIDNLSLHHYYEAIIGRSDTRAALWHSLDYALASATVCVVLAFAVAYVRERKPNVLRSTLGYLAMTPLGLPGVVLGMGLIGAWIHVPVAVYGTLWILLLAYVAGHLPVALQTVGSGIVQIDRSLEDAARSLGAGWASAVARILLPISRGSLVSAWGLVFIPIMAEFSATLLLYSPGTETVSVAIYDLQERGSVETLCALSVVTAVLTLAVFGAVALLGRQRLQRHGAMTRLLRRQ